MAEQRRIDEAAFRQGVIDGLTLAPLRLALARLFTSVFAPDRAPRLFDNAPVSLMDRHDRKDTAVRQTKKAGNGH